MENTGMTLEQFLNDWNNNRSVIEVHTSGSTGVPKKIFVEKQRMISSAMMTCSYLNLSSTDTALLCMPLDYIAGKMMVIRSLVCGMKLISVNPSSHPLSNLTESPSFAAMVPMQVYCSLQVEHERKLLMGIKNLLIGGGAVDKKLSEVLKSFPNAVWSTYGMTETLSHIALRRLSGSDASDYYTPFSNISVSLNDKSCLCIEAPNLCQQVLVTNDVAEFSETDSRQFRILGRIDNVIDSGGIKIQIEDIEEAIHDKLDIEFAITKQPDEKFGETIAILIKFDNLPDNAFTDKHEYEEDCPISKKVMQIKDTLMHILPKYWIPRQYYVCSRIPHTGTGKIARKEVYEMVTNLSPII